MKATIAAPEFCNTKHKAQSALPVLPIPLAGPLLNSYATIASEIFQDSGVPHTLEHLIFLGSKQYPYKGVLDSLANRAFASGTNAWTANDHTAYTLTTAGSDGFLRMLDVYLDHTFFPTLTQSGFVTEVYHVNGKGEDAGVVFSEMQGWVPGSTIARQLAVDTEPTRQSPALTDAKTRRET